MVRLLRAAALVLLAFVEIAAGCLLATRLRVGAGILVLLTAFVGYIFTFRLGLRQTGLDWEAWQGRDEAEAEIRQGGQVTASQARTGARRP